MAPDPQSAALWDSVASSYDERRPDQGLTDPRVREAWRALLGGLLPPAPARILDIGCGTGSLSLLLAADGHAVTGIDFSPAMIALAREKAATAGAPVALFVQDAMAPAFPPSSFDAIVARQVLWALPDAAAALRSWAALLRRNGRLILVEGRFASGRGMSETEIAEALPPGLRTSATRDLSADDALWGGPIPDQRLLIVARRALDAAQLGWGSLG